MTLRSIFSKVFNKKERHDYPVGWLSSGKTLEDLRVHLHKEWGFGRERNSKIEQDQVLHWIKPTEKGEEYHIWVHDDGEIRGCLKSQHKLLEEREKFLEFLGEFAVKRKNVSNLVLDPTLYSPDGEIIKEE